MKVGDYVRIDGYISKIEHLKTSSSGKTYAQWKQPNGMLASANIIIIDEFSQNIIDLIVKDDLLKIIYPIGREKDLFQEEVTQVIENEDNKLYIKLYTERYVLLENLSRYDIKIKSIVTKEQFEKMQYIVGSDEK